MIHVADASDPLVEERIESVEKIIESTGYDSIPQQIVFNKSDKAQKHIAARLERIYNGPVISALDKTNLPELLELIDRRVNNILELEPEDSRAALQLNTA